MSSVSRRFWLPVLTFTVLCLGAPPALAATALVPEAATVRTADAAVTPGNIGAPAPDGYESNDDADHATLLRIGGPLQDHTIRAGEQDWFELWAADGTGYIRIGATGGLRVDRVPVFADRQDPLADVDGPEGWGADLTEVRILLHGFDAADQGLDTYCMVVQTARRSSFATAGSCWRGTA